MSCEEKIISNKKIVFSHKYEGNSEEKKSVAICKGILQVIITLYKIENNIYSIDQFFKI